MVISAISLLGTNRTSLIVATGKVNCRCSGVGLTRIDGIESFTALKVISEIGTDMTSWATAKCFASWLGLSPDNRITAGKVMSQGPNPAPTGPQRHYAPGGPRAAPLRQRLGGLPAPEESALGSAQGHHRHGAQAGDAHLLHAALRPRLRRCWRRILRELISTTGVARCFTARIPTGLQAVPMSDAPDVPPTRRPSTEKPY